MRHKSNKQDGYVIYAVAGTDVISFGIDSTGADTKGLLGFAVERHDLTEKEKYFMMGFKVFKEMVPKPEENVLVSTNEHPVQSFVWDDFTAKPGHRYEYSFYPVKGSPKFLDRQAPVKIKVETEELYTDQEHDVFFNRGVASSQAYARRFNNLAPDKIDDPKLQTEAYQWLSRNLDEAFYKFIDQAKKGDFLYGCFYEFHYPEALQKFREAIDRDVNVMLIIDCKNNESTDKEGNFHESFPKEANLKAIKKAKIPMKNVIKRTANKNAISHNKFLVYQPANSNEPTQVWTGSTNISEGGIFGQTNVGHWVKNKKTATDYKAYWDLLSEDPGKEEGAPRGDTANKEFKTSVAELSADLTLDDIRNSNETILPVFSPRQELTILDTYFELVDQASDLANITLAFGVNEDLKQKLLDNSFTSQLVFMLLEKKDAPAARSKNKDAFVELKPANNVYEAYGSYIKDPLYKWTKETNTLSMGLNSHVKYVHTKFLLHDPLGPNPIVVTGSANFSKASTNNNDENMIVIKDNLRAADIYFTEFNRLFNHYYYRSVLQELKAQGIAPSAESLFLAPDDSWLEKYKPGKLRRKRVELYTKMSGATVLP